MEEITQKSLRVAASDLISTMACGNNHRGIARGHARFCGIDYQILE
jgi:hypothetical protein